jgi:predicted sulfurtransferase
LESILLEKIPEKGAISSSSFQASRAPSLFFQSKADLFFSFLDGRTEKTKTELCQGKLSRKITMFAVGTGFYYGCQGRRNLVSSVAAGILLLLIVPTDFSQAFLPLPTRPSCCVPPSSNFLAESASASSNTNNKVWIADQQQKHQQSPIDDSPTTVGSLAVRSQRPPTTPTNDTAASLLQMLSFYDFREISNPAQLRDDVFEELSHSIPGIRGTLYLAHEGMNGQFAVPVDYMEDFRSICQELLQLNCDQRFNLGDIVPLSTPTFEKFIVRTRNQILRDGGMRNIKNNNLVLDWKEAGIELSPQEWDQELRRRQQQTQHEQQDSSSSSQSSSTSKMPLILDCRNEYESSMGTFQSAIPLNTTTFSESWDVLNQLLAYQKEESTVNKSDPVYIFCTGGVRCVKVGAYMKQVLGFTNVRRLEHGIIAYQKWWDDNSEKNDGDDGSSKGSDKRQSLWQGENFLFDQRRLVAGENTYSSKKQP